MKNPILNIGITKRTSVIHYVFCYFVAQLLMEMKKNIINDILLDVINKFMTNRNKNDKYIDYYIKLINIGIDFIIILIVVIFFFTRKKMDKKKYKKKLTKLKTQRKKK